MDRVANIIKIAAVAICPAVAGLLGGWDVFLRTLIILTVLDFLTGILSAIYNKRLSSMIGSKGVIKKIGFYIMVAVACLLDQMLGTKEVLRTATIGFYISVEGISILENWGKMGLPLPPIVRKVLLQLQEKSNSTEAEENADKDT